MVRSVKLRVVGCPYGDSRDDRVTAVDGQAPDWAWERRRSGMRGGRWRVKGERDAGTAAGLAKRCWLASAAGSGTASRRRGRRSGPLTRLTGEYPGRQGSAVVAADRGRLPGGGEHSLPASHPTAEPCLPARAGVRGLAPGAGLRPGVRSCVAHPAAHAGAMPAAMRRNSARRSVWTRRARGGRSPRRRPRRAGRSPCPGPLKSHQASSQPLHNALRLLNRPESMPGLRYTCAFGSEWNLA